LIRINREPLKVAKMRPAEAGGARHGHDMGQLIFQCPKTKKEFDSGFQAKATDLMLLPRGATIRLRCMVCGEIHEYNFANARIGEEG
jgi:hypothetical protein